MLGIYHQFIHWAFSSDSDGWLYYWNGVLFGGVFVTIACMFVSWALTDNIWHKKNSKYGSVPTRKTIAAALRGFATGAAIMFVWPWALMALLPLLALAVVAGIVWSFLELLPPRAERLAKKKHQVEELRARKSELMRG